MNDQGKTGEVQLGTRDMRCPYVWVSVTHGYKIPVFKRLCLSEKVCE